MGIQNFKIFLNTLNYTSNEPTEFDSLFVDIQSYLYQSIYSSFKSNESEFLEDICLKVVDNLSELFYNVFSTNLYSDTFKIIISFDGESIPMKYPIQKERRNSTIKTGKQLYKTVLLGYNIISEKVYKYIFDIITNNFSVFLNSMKNIKIPSDLQIILCGSSIRGEGEHKLFHLGKYFKCCKPIIASIDNDVFIIALSQLNKFESIQIYKTVNVIFNINIFISSFLPYDKNYIIFASLLFGNDFIPPIILLTANNCPFIHEALRKCKKSYIPHIFYNILNHLKNHSKIKYVIPPQIEEDIIIEFWNNCFWVLDYYKNYNFDQKYMNNNLYYNFNRNHIITALVDLEYSEKSYQKAYMKYKTLKTVSISNSKQSIFNEEELQIYQRFFPKAIHSEIYHQIKINKSEE